MKNDRNEMNSQKENIQDKKNSAGENLSSNEIDRIIDDVESEYFSFEYAPAITKTQKNSIHSLMVGVAENVSAIFSSYRNEKITFSLAEIDSCTTSEYLKTVADDSVLFAFDFDGTQCEVDVSFVFFKRLTGIGGIERKSMSAVDSKLCFAFIIKPILSELLRKFNLKSTTNLNFRTPKVIEKNLREELPFMASENIMMEAVKQGGDRQELHELIRQHAQAAGAVVKQEGRPNDLLERLKNDPAFANVDFGEVTNPSKYVGRAPEQVVEFMTEVMQPIYDKYEGVTAEVEAMKC